jgi:hypothetical protein
MAGTECAPVDTGNTLPAPNAPKRLDATNRQVNAPARRNAQATSGIHTDGRWRRTNSA